MSFIIARKIVMLYMLFSNITGKHYVELLFVQIKMCIYFLNLFHNISYMYDSNDFYTYYASMYRSEWNMFLYIYIYICNLV